MSKAADSQRTKLLRIGFYTSSDGSKKDKESLTISAFKKLYDECVSRSLNYKAIDSHDKKVKITFLEKDIEDNFYYGFMSMFRNSSHLAYIADNEWNEEKIPLSPTRQLVERSYFIYYPKSDLLLLSQNHLGPKASDLSYALFNTMKGKTLVTFAAIWKQQSIKELLETGTILRSCELTIAAPRDFNRANYNLQGQLSSQLADMLAGAGLSHLDITLRGQSPVKNSSFEWLSEDVKLSLKELLELFTPKNGGVEIEKANVIKKGNKRKTSLLDQVLIHTKSVKLQGDGYPNDTDVKIAMIQAKVENSDYLAQYDISG
ncbi:hypothetical protein [Xenorhabdus sp. PB62.4]|uniref:hypothetical protein n=1 Tax=Xenorhabdus sp. PB62.4 TaxID=1851573 RepID=UPI001656DB2E|nr:hypothetical protein [Xenorhabdus sp. PB62.4]MBC8954946.1 hypothetical protein [Xenorhabdus sp. PB62.4]